MFPAARRTFQARPQSPEGGRALEADPPLPVGVADGAAVAEAEAQRRFDVLDPQVPPSCRRRPRPGDDRDGPEEDEGEGRGVQEAGAGDAGVPHQKAGSRLPVLHAHMGPGTGRPVGVEPPEALEGRESALHVTMACGRRGRPRCGPGRHDVRTGHFLPRRSRGSALRAVPGYGGSTSSDGVDLGGCGWPCRRAGPPAEAYRCCANQSAKRVAASCAPGPGTRESSCNSDP